MNTIPSRQQSLTLVKDGEDFDQGSHVQDVVKIKETGVQKLEALETLVEVRYVGITPADVSTLNVMHKNNTPGFELSGVVVQDTSGKWNEGDRVFGLCYGAMGSTLRDEKVRKSKEDQGAYAQYAIVHSDFLVRIPDGESFERTSALMYAHAVAFQAYGFENWPAKQSEDHAPVLICGGSTMVGLAAIQIAHRLGHRVLTTTSTNHFDLCREYGADKVYDFKDSDIDAQIREDSQNNLQFAIDAVCMGSSTTVAYKSMGAKGGRITTVLPRNNTELGARSEITIEMKLPTTLWGHSATWQGIDFPITQNEHANARAFFKDLGTYLKDGKYKYLPVKAHANHGLDGVLESLEQVRKNHPSGYRLVACVKEH